MFKHSVKGFSNYLFAKGGYILRLDYTTKHNHYKYKRFVSYSRSDNRCTLYSDKGKQERLSKRAIKNRGFVELDEPLFIPMACDLSNDPF
jgi:hypothetical protein